MLARLVIESNSDMPGLHFDGPELLAGLSIEQRYVRAQLTFVLIDGRDSVSFLVRIKELIENPVLMMFDGTDPEKLLLSALPSFNKLLHSPFTDTPACLPLLCLATVESSS